MASPEQVDELIASVTALKNRIDAMADGYAAGLAAQEAGYAALANDLQRTAQDEIYREVFVDATNGSDANDGSENFPVATFAAARTLTGQGGTLALRLLSNYTLQREFEVPLGCNLIITGDGSGKTLSFADADFDNPSRAPRIAMPQSGQTIHLRKVTIQSRQLAASVTSKHMINVSGITNVIPWNCTFQASAGDDLALLSDGFKFTLVPMASTFDAGFDGLYVEGVAAGTDPATVASCFTTTLNNF